MRIRRSTMAATAAGSLLLLGGCTTADTGSEPDAGADPTSPPSAETVVEGEGPVEPGRYALPFVALDASVAAAEVDVPPGFELYNGSFLWSGDGRGHRALSFWSVTGVDPDPCTGSSGGYEDAGSSLEALAKAMRGQRHRAGPPAVPTTFAGYEGLYLELSLPTRFDPERCDTGAYEAWQAKDSDSYTTYDRYQYGPGSVDHIWILDVRGRRLVVNAMYGRGISDRQAAALDEMVDSIAIRVAD